MQGCARRCGALPVVQVTEARRAAWGPGPPQKSGFCGASSGEAGRSTRVRRRGELRVSGRRGGAGAGGSRGVATFFLTGEIATRSAGDGLSRPLSGRRSRCVSHVSCGSSCLFRVLT